MNPDRQDRDNPYGTMFRYLGLGLELGGGLAGCVLVGWLIDRWLDTAPRAMIALATFGAIAGMYNFIRQAVRMTRQQERERARRREQHEDRDRDGRAG